MRILLLSDLHLEFGDRARPPALHGQSDVDLVVLAGDIHVGTAGIDWARSTFRHQPVIYVLGNHEFYHSDFDQLIEDARECAKGSNVRVLENESLELRGLRILGCTLWTDFHANGPDLEGPSMSIALRGLNDYSIIRTTTGQLSPVQTRDRCRESHAWLSQQIATSNQPLLVVTHHAPTLAAVDPRYEDDALVPSFYNAFEDLIRTPVSCWAYGHTHYNRDFVLNGVRVISNQKGYPREHVENFSWGRIIELDLPP